MVISQKLSVLGLTNRYKHETKYAKNTVYLDQGHLMR